MSWQERIDKNIKIAEFMGYKKDKYDHGVNGESVIYISPHDKHYYKAPCEFSYDQNWNSLMEVVEKIEEENELMIYDNVCEIKHDKDVTRTEGDTKLDAVFKAVLKQIDASD